MNIKDHLLSSGQWFAEVVEKKYILWHGTQGRTAQTPSNGQPGQAVSSIDGWNESPDRIGTPFLIDRDGTVYRTFKDEREWIFHLGLKGTNGKYDRASIGIEFANELELIKQDGNFYAFDRVHSNTRYTGPVVQRRWRAREWWARLEEAQVDAGIELTLDLCNRHGIPKTFYFPSTTFDYPHCFEIAGILCHSNCREDKTDLILEDWVWKKLADAGFQFVGANVAPVGLSPVFLAGAAPAPPVSDAATTAAALLKSDLLRGSAALERVAAGHAALVASGGEVEGIGPVQDALIHLGFPISLDGHRGFFGPKTENAIKAFQQSAPGIEGMDGRVDSDTLLALDAALLTHDQEVVPPPAAPGVKLGSKPVELATMEESLGGSKKRKVPLYHLPDRAGYFYIGAMAIDVDGSPRAYSAGATEPKPLDKLSSADSAGSSTSFIQGRTKNGRFGEGPFKDFFVSGTSLRFKKDEGFKTSNFVDAEFIPYIVFPPKFRDVALGDMAYVIDLETMRATHAIFADTNNSTRVAEASLRVALNLGQTSLNAGNGDEEDHYLYIVFPQTAFTPEESVPHWPDALIKETAGQCFAEWGGMGQAEAVARELGHLA